jgi:hypothetical protein
MTRRGLAKPIWSMATNNSPKARLGHAWRELGRRPDSQNQTINPETAVERPGKTHTRRSDIFGIGSTISQRQKLRAGGGGTAMARTDDLFRQRIRCRIIWSSWGLRCCLSAETSSEACSQRVYTRRMVNRCGAACRSRDCHRSGQRGSDAPNSGRDICVVHGRGFYGRCSGFRPADEGRARIPPDDRHGKFRPLDGLYCRRSRRCERRANDGRRHQNRGQFGLADRTEPTYRQHPRWLCQRRQFPAQRYRPPQTNGHRAPCACSRFRCRKPRFLAASGSGQQPPTWSSGLHDGCAAPDHGRRRASRRPTRTASLDFDNGIRSRRATFAMLSSYVG